MTRLTPIVIIITIFIPNFVTGNDIFSTLINSLKKDDRKPKYHFTFKNILELKRGLRNEDIYLNVTQLITKYNYPVEEHTVQTQDGYLLKLIRIPNRGRPIAFLMHGLLCSADDFVTVGPESALPYLLYNQGYDVWLGNARGNKYSRDNVYLSPDTSTFWNFTWNEIGIYDLPAMISFALHKARKSNLIYIGHSQGTTTFFVMCSQMKCDHITLMIALTPVAWVKHIKAPLVRILAPFAKDLGVLSKLVGANEFLPSNPFMKIFSNFICPNVELAVLLCNNVGFTVFGFDYGQMNISNAPVLYGHLPAGTSTKDVLHYLQEVNSGYFRKFDYGLKNLKIYDQLQPPEYDVKKINVPVALYYGNNDWLSVYDDIENLISYLPNIIKIYRVPYDQFNHMDFLWAKDVKSLLYYDVIALMGNYINKH